MAEAKKAKNSVPLPLKGGRGSAASSSSSSSVVTRRTGSGSGTGSESGDTQQSSPYVGNKYSGPNGQTQKSVLYKPGQCIYGCHMQVAKSEMSEHKPLCTKYKEYRKARNAYIGDDRRVAEQPSKFVLYEENALEGRAVENPHGFRYMEGPFSLKKTLKQANKDFADYKAEKRSSQKREKEEAEAKKKMREIQKMEREERRMKKKVVILKEEKEKKEE